MVRVLIVDDEAVVRRGLKLTLPWEQYGLKVVGDVQNGPKALAFLDQTEVDLVLVDLTMPAMSGFQVMEEMKRRHSRVRFAVLTCHQDFGYVQEALRMGAIDYIVKTELEKDRVHGLLARIQELFLKSPAPGPAEGRIGYHVVPAGVPAGEAWPARLREEPRWSDLPEDGGFWVPGNGSDFKPESLGESAILTEVELIEGGRESQLRELVQRYQENGLFYEGRRGAVNRLSLHALRFQDPPVPSHADCEEWTARLLEFRWILSDSAFEESLSHLRSKRWPRTTLIASYRNILETWNRWFAPALAVDAAIDPSRIRLFGDLEERLHAFREAAVSKIGELQYSVDMARGIFKSVHYIYVRNPNYSLEDMAAYANISKSYFSRVFKDFTGRTYGDLVKDVKIDTAKRMLAQTNDPIYLIAKKSGFDDDKYFSKWFRHHAGSLPSEYRIHCRKSEGGSRTAKR
ncbi:MAG TPA: response regulator [Paenibacillus sp.]|nr:response regulator [Paenibacillus sp.]